jgi:hypothetical protein
VKLVRDPLLHLEVASDFDELCAIEEQTRGVDVNIEFDLMVVARLSRRARTVRNWNEDLSRSLGNFGDLG